jgi:hypothetical protein
VQPEKSVFVFLWYLSKQDTLLAIADRFDLVPATIMQIVSVFLYILNSLKNHIFWPKRWYFHQLYPLLVKCIQSTYSI